MVGAIVRLEVIKAHFKSSAKFDSNLLLLLENELIVLHVLLCVGLQIGPDLMKIETVLISALLAIHEKLTEFTCPERGPKHPVE
jgi:hypothetical protein